MAWSVDEQTFMNFNYLSCVTVWVGDCVIDSGQFWESSLSN